MQREPGSAPVLATRFDEQPRASAVEPVLSVRKRGGFRFEKWGAGSPAVSDHNAVSWGSRSDGSSIATRTKSSSTPSISPCENGSRRTM